MTIKIYKKALKLYRLSCNCIGYITHGMSETIQLEKGKWYSVEGAGELTIRPVNVRIE